MWGPRIRYMRYTLRVSTETEKTTYYPKEIDRTKKTNNSTSKSLKKIRIEKSNIKKGRERKNLEPKRKRKSKNGNTQRNTKFSQISGSRTTWGAKTNRIRVPGMRVKRQKYVPLCQEKHQGKQKWTEKKKEEGDEQRKKNEKEQTFRVKEKRNIYTNRDRNRGKRGRKEERGGGGKKQNEGGEIHRGCLQQSPKYVSDDFGLPALCHPWTRNSSREFSEKVLCIKIDFFFFAYGTTNQKAELEFPFMVLKPT